MTEPLPTSPGIPEPPPDRPTCCDALPLATGRGHAHRHDCTRQADRITYPDETRQSAPGSPPDLVDVGDGTFVRPGSVEAITAWAAGSSTQVFLSSGQSVLVRGTTAGEVVTRLGVAAPAGPAR